MNVVEIEILFKSGQRATVSRPGGAKKLFQDFRETLGDDPHCGLCRIADDCLVDINEIAGVFPKQPKVAWERIHEAEFYAWLDRQFPSNRGDDDSPTT